MAIQVNLKTIITICNVYSPDSTLLSLRNLNLIIIQLPKHFLILGDINSRNIIWGSSQTDNRGKMKEKLLEKPSLILLNNGDLTRHNSTNSCPSAVDLTMSSTNIAPEVYWKVLTEYNGIDH